MRKILLILSVILIIIMVSCNDDKTTEPKKEVAAPAFSPPQGSFNTPQQVTISCETEGAAIRFTTTGDMPTKHSELYAEPLAITEDTVLMAKAFKKNYQDSKVTTGIYHIEEIVLPDTVAVPAFQPPAGEYHPGQVITISCETEGAIIRYTQNGEVPTSESEIYSEPLTITESVTLMAKAFKTGWIDSSVGKAEYVIIETPPNTVSAPVFNPPAGVYTEPQRVTINTVTVRAVIRYTTNGEEPTASSSIYSEPINVSEDMEIKAYAAREGLLDSNVSSSRYDITGTVARPTIHPSMGVYTEPQLITLNCVTEGAVIRYTVNDDDPSENSPQYTEPFMIDQDTVVRAQAFKENWTPSSHLIAYYTITGKVANPVFDPPGGLYTTPQQIALNTETMGAEIRYTLNGGEPTQEDNLYAGLISITEDTVIKAKAFGEGWIDSETTTSSYLITGRVAAPTFDPPQGIYRDKQFISIKCEDGGTLIRFTIDDQEPTEESPEYSDPIEITETTIIKAKAYKPDWDESETSSSLYTITGTIATPVIEPPGGHFSAAQYVTISTATGGVTIRYTTDGTEPTEESERFSLPLVTYTDTHIRAKAFSEHWYDSEEVEESYTFDEPQHIEGMVFVMGGTFKPTFSYTVGLTSYHIGKYEVTQEEFEEVMGYNPSVFRGNPDLPVDDIRWYDAVEYCNRRSIKEGLTPSYSYSHYGTNPDDWPFDWNIPTENHINIACNWEADGYRLPTEMEWEFAARGGVVAQRNRTFHTSYSGSGRVDLVAWHSENCGDPITTHPVATKEPNELETYDMSGNVWELCWDIMGDYPMGVFINPRGAEMGDRRALRGGGVNAPGEICRVAPRYSTSPIHSSNICGFRVVRVPN